MFLMILFYFIWDIGNTWINNSGWNDSSTLYCDWFGVTCIEGTISSLNLTSNNLQGYIPASFGRLTTMTMLILRGNNLEGIDGLLPSLINILDLSNNSLTDISGSLDQLSTLRELNLSNNHLKVLPHSQSDWTFCQTWSNCFFDIHNNYISQLDPNLLHLAWPYAQRVDLSNNQIQYIPAITPPPLWYASKTVYFDASHNQISVMPNISLWSGTLSVFDLSFNAMTGKLAIVGAPPPLVELNLSNNKFTSIDSSFNCSSFPLLHECTFAGNPFKCPVSPTTSCCQTDC